MIQQLGSKTEFYLMLWAMLTMIRIGMFQELQKQLVIIYFKESLIFVEVTLVIGMRQGVALTMIVQKPLIRLVNGKLLIVL